MYCIFAGTTATASPTHSFVNLKQLLQVSDSDKIILPSVYVEEIEEVSLKFKFHIHLYLQNDLQKAITYPKSLLQITDRPSILESLDVNEYLVLRAKDAHSKPTEVCLTVI